MTTITRLLIAGTALSLGLGLMHSQSAFAQDRHPQVLRGLCPADDAGRRSCSRDSGCGDLPCARYR